MSRVRVRIVAAVSACAAAIAVAAAPPAAAAGHPAGPIGTSVVIAKAADLIGPYDVATNAAGTAYIGWIANSPAPQSRQVHLCTLPVTARACVGGVQTISTFSPSASGLRVLAAPSGNSTKVTLVWFDDTDASLTGPQGGAIVTATAVNGLHLSAATDVASAPSHGELLDAQLSPSGALWTVAYAGVGKGAVQVRSAPTNPYVTLHAPYSIGVGKLAFSGSTPILAITKYGAVSTAAAWTSRSAKGAWSAFARVAGTWTTGGLSLTHSSHGVRLITTVDNASYRPVIAAWNGHGFNRRALTPDADPCGPSSHDGSTDPSGRVVDASWECNDVAIADYADGAHASIVRIHTPGTPTNQPQVAAGTRGIATVAWSNEDTAGGSDLHVTRVRLNAATRTVHVHATGGGVYVSGPVSCLPAVQTHVGVRAVAAKGWKLVRRSLALGSSTVSGTSIDGAALASGKSYTLHGAAVFGKGSQRSIARVALTFRTC